MPYYTQEQIRKAREMDLLTYLQLHDPGQLVHLSGNEYCTREHDSLKISNGKWMWFSRGFGGVTALDYLIKVRQIPFMDAMAMMLSTKDKSPSFFHAQRLDKTDSRPKRRLLLPERSESNDQIISYLTGRGIDREIIEACIKEGLLYESLPYHSCIFVGYDQQGTARYACFRATDEKKIMGDAAGSEKRFAFRIERPGRTIHIFESAIDLLSFATVMKYQTGEYTVENAIAFSNMQAEKHGWSGYGDKQYPAHVLRYYPYGSYNIGVGNTAIVKVAEQQLGNTGGRKFWSWYGFGDRVSWCGCFVSWCADQCGYIKSGTIPKFSYVPDIVDWAKSHHQWQTRNYKPSPGDIIVVDWYANGTRDHVGIVEKCVGNIVYTIEGNRSDQVKRGTYTVGSGLVFGYFVPRY